MVKHIKRAENLRSRQQRIGVETALKIIGPKWTVLIIKELLVGMKRFGEIEKALGGISPRTLSLRLSTMEQSGILERKVFAEVPPRVEYRLTASGKALEHVLSAMEQWGDANSGKTTSRRTR
jgi:DNA-binding HxlR family transcriptional regulator